jgi:hypothetical protein
MLGRCGSNKRRITGSISTEIGCRIGFSSRLCLGPIAAACKLQYLFDTINLLFTVTSLFVFCYPPRPMFLCSCKFKLIPSYQSLFPRLLTTWLVDHLTTVVASSRKRDIIIVQSMQYRHISPTRGNRIMEPPRPRLCNHGTRRTATR